MKQILLGTLGLLMIGGVGCKRSDNTTVNLPSNGWLINGNTYTVSDATCFSGTFTARDSFSHSVVIHFYSTPITDKVYKIVDKDYVNYCRMKLGYTSTIAATITTIVMRPRQLLVKMTNGRVNVTVPESG